MENKLLKITALCVATVLTSGVTTHASCRNKVSGDVYERVEVGSLRSTSGLRTTDACVDYIDGRGYVMLLQDGGIMRFMDDRSQLYDSLLDIVGKLRGPRDGKIVEMGGHDGKTEYLYYYDSDGRLVADEIRYAGDEYPSYYRHVVEYQGNVPTRMESIWYHIRDGIYEEHEGETWFLKYDEEGCMTEEMKIYREHQYWLYEYIRHGY